LCSARAKYIGYLTEGFVEFHILINAFDCPALGYAPTMLSPARVVALAATNDVCLNLCVDVGYVKYCCGIRKLKAKAPEGPMTKFAMRQIFKVCKLSWTNCR
jgi:hypothetical protein